jgi:hypothetical protein
MKQKDILDSLDLAQSILGQWVRYRDFFYKAISAEAIALDEETQFREVTSTLAQNIKRLQQRIDEKKFPFRGNEISAQLKNVISVQHMRNMPVADRKVFYKEWHLSMVYISRTMGALKFLSEGYQPPLPKAAAGKKGKKGGIPKPVLIGGGVLLVCGLVFGLLVALGIVG